MLSRRVGKIHEVEKFILLAEDSRFLKNSDANRSLNTGLHYCKGLVQWFGNHDPRAALKEFNQVFLFYFFNGGWFSFFFPFYFYVVIPSPAK